MKLKLEINQKFMEENTEFKVGKSVVLVTPPLDEDYWLLRVKVSETQAVVGFPKFFTIGIGFAIEEDWNTNLPYSCDAEDIFKHISHNKGDESILDSDCVEAIKMIQAEAERIQKHSSN